MLHWSHLPLNTECKYYQHMFLWTQTSWSFFTYCTPEINELTWWTPLKFWDKKFAFLNVKPTYKCYRTKLQIFTVSVRTLLSSLIKLLKLRLSWWNLDKPVLQFPTADRSAFVLWEKHLTWAVLTKPRPPLTHLKETRKHLAIVPD